MPSDLLIILNFRYYLSNNMIVDFDHIDSTSQSGAYNDPAR